jgi:hypothetical protein
VREAARRRLEGSIDRLLAALVEIALDDSQPAAARVAAIKDGLDRSGFGTRDNKLTVEIKPYEEDIAGLLVDADYDHEAFLRAVGPRIVPGEVTTSEVDQP